jgi:hypothetical protein
MQLQQKGTSNQFLILNRKSFSSCLLNQNSNEKSKN